MLYDLDKQKPVYEYNATKYFTPASNTKIFTFFAGLNILGDSVPALRYFIAGDSLIFWGTGDPSFLYKHVYQNGNVFSFLKSTDKALYFSTSNFNTTHFGSGWAWDDYNDSYSTERSPFPVYGNSFTIRANRVDVKIHPLRLQEHLTIGKKSDVPKVIRKLENNDIEFFPSSGDKFEMDVPLKIDPDLAVKLIADTLHREVRLLNIPLIREAKTFYSIPTDSLYSVMMKASDNFIAEQLLLLCSGVISDTLQPEIAITYAKKFLLHDLADAPLWVDGSGLSRYNLFTPRSIVELWKKIYQLVPQQRLFDLLAAGGKSGTIRSWYKSDKPYVFGKTGSLSNNHCLSGYLVTKTGKILIFSFMNSNFVVPSSNIRENMQSILNLIYEKY
jgi:serine-type D-Ala-D-Ala carboxypeptidase/endopeptidase (penicillin-binding protein 4)